MADGYRGLPHVVDVWKGLDDKKRIQVRFNAPDLADILDRSVQYMKQVEKQFPINDAGPRPTLVQHSSMTAETGQIDIRPGWVRDMDPDELWEPPKRRREDGCE